MKKIYFFLPDYPKWGTGGHKYHTILFEYFKKMMPETFSFGHHKYSKYFETNKILKIISGIYYTIKIPKNSVLIMSNASFLNYYMPVVLNKFWKNHFYFLIIHHLAMDENPSYMRRTLENYFIKKAGKVVTVSNVSRKKLYDLNPKLDKIEIVSPGLDSSIKGKEYKKIFPQKLKLLFVGIIEERKGILYLIEALKFISSKDYELNIIGEKINSKKYYDLLLNKIKDLNLEKKVFFRGRVSKEELEDYYLNSSIFIFPTLWEGYGMVVSEAMSYGLPVIASRIPAIEELIDDGLNGLLVEPENAGEIGEKINILLSDERLIYKLSENAIKKSLVFPTWNETCEKIYKIIKFK